MSERRSKTGTANHYMSPTQASLSRRRRTARATISKDTFIRIFEDSNPAALTEKELHSKTRYDGKFAAAYSAQIIDLEGVIYNDLEHMLRLSHRKTLVVAPALPRASIGPEKSWDEIASEHRALHAQLDARRQSKDYEPAFTRDQEGHLWGFRKLTRSPMDCSSPLHRVDSTIDDGRVTIVQVAAWEHQDPYLGSFHTVDDADAFLYNATGVTSQIPEHTDALWDPNFPQVDTPWTLMQFEGGQNYMDGRPITQHPAASWDPRELDDIPEHEAHMESHSFSNVGTVNTDVQEIANDRRHMETLRDVVDKALLEKVDTLEQDKLELSRFAARHQTINARLQNRLQHTNENLKACEHRLTTAENRTQQFIEAFCRLSIMVEKYEAMDFVNDGRAVLDDVRWIMRSLVQ